MTATTSIRALLIDDDPEQLEGMMKSLPTTIDDFAGIAMDYDPCATFEEAAVRVKRFSYDLVITDFYKDSNKDKAGYLPEGESDIPNLVKGVRNGKFCPVIIFSSRKKPGNVDFGPFVLWADKSQGDKQVKAGIVQILKTGIPQAARRLRDEIDGLGGKYLWGFLEQNWDALSKAGWGSGKALDRMIRRRASVQLARVEGDKERASVDGSEFYLTPRIADKEYRLGEIVQHKQSGQIRVLLTPHCHLTVQFGKNQPKADFVLTVAAFEALGVITKNILPDKLKGVQKTDEKKQEAVRTWIQSPSQFGSPLGRYWFLPGFLKLPDSFCDFMQVTSINFAELQSDYEPLMVLDAPFAEAMQACFSTFYSAIGLANLDAASYLHIVPK